MFKLNENYAHEINFFYKNREISDGITFFECNLNWDRYLADHKRKF